MKEPESRIAIFSARNFGQHASFSHSFEFEDTIAEELDAADIFAPATGRGFGMLHRGKNFLSRKTNLAKSFPSGLTRTPMMKSYDLFFYTIAQLRDLNNLDSVPNWRKNSEVAIVWIQELWLSSFEEQGALFEQLEQFDYVICSFSKTANALHDKLKTKVIKMPWGLDTLRFCPYPNPPTRSIEVLNIGVRNQVTHRELLKRSKDAGTLYLYDTLSGLANMPDYRAHRNNFIGQIQRSEFFFSHIAKVDRTIERGDQIEFGLRYIEGMAAGSILLGSNIDSDYFRENLDWEDSVFESPFECPDIVDMLEDLKSQPDRLQAARNRNIKECLTRHDHLYRWQEVLKLAGLSATSKMDVRQEKLIKAIKAL